MRAASAFFLLAVTVALPSGAVAQTALAVEAGAVTAFADAVIQIGFRVAPTRGGYGAADVAAATFPDALASGVAFIMFDADVAFGFPAAADAQTVFFPRGGFSVIGGGGGSGGGGGAEVGFNLGIGVLAKISPTLGLRIDYTHRRFLESGETYPLSSITVGIVFLR